ncbi:hypothetical protein [Methanoregula sp.]|uniref:hypothetical protein n=1 Tax=Methanoregula sp. TaxID=2052170 RepID=UPI002BA32136|nr:hypothetical protein [Methanoregula sp.]HVP96998.1 hypothetical protein [Methanoregula sp.]
MNTHHANIAGHAAGPGVPGTAGNLPGKPAVRLSGIRSSGQYCRCRELTSEVTTPAHRVIRGRSAADGMCPLKNRS